MLLLICTDTPRLPCPPQTSYSKKRMRQMNPLYRETNQQHFYPCPKCDAGFLKLRHHLCPCDQKKVNAKAVVKVRGRWCESAVQAGRHRAA